MLKKGMVLLSLVLVVLGCESDNGYRVLTAEIEISALPSNCDVCYAEGAIYLKIEGTNTEIDLGHYDAGSTKTIIKSQEYACNPGSNVSYEFYVDGTNNSTDPNIVSTDGVLGSNVEIRVKSNNKTIFTRKFNRGEKWTQEEGNILIR